MHSDSDLLYPTPSDLNKNRMMVAEFVTRAQSGSPLNGELPLHNSNMPSSQGREGSMQNSPSGFLGQDVVLGPVSPCPPSGADGYSTSASVYELAAHIKRKELFSQRKQREFIPDNKKDDNYWDRRRRNNEAAKRSREKRRFNDMVLEQRVVELTKENHVLKAQLEAIKEEYGICGENIVCVEKVMATLPTSDQVLSITKRPKLGPGSPPGLLFQSAPSPIPTPVIHQPINHPVMCSPSPGILHGSGPTHLLHLHQSHPASAHHETLGYQHRHHLHQYQDPDAFHHRTTYANYQHSPFPSQYDDTSAAAVMAAATARAVQDLENDNALNLSSRSRARSRSRSANRDQSPFEISSGSGSSDECCQSVTVPLSVGNFTPVAVTASQVVTDSNNSLPLKLRHKSHLGDKDAASALLSLQNIKQEPEPRSSPPWDGEGSSDERDSGISLGAEWPSGSAAAVVTAALVLQRRSQMVSGSDDTETENKHRLHSEIVRLSTEVANLKSLVIRNKGTVETMLHSQY